MSLSLSLLSCFPIPNVSYRWCNVCFALLCFALLCFAFCSLLYWLLFIINIGYCIHMKNIFDSSEHYYCRYHYHYHYTFPFRMFLIDGVMFAFCSLLYWLLFIINIGYYIHMKNIFDISNKKEIMMTIIYVFIQR